MKDHPISRDSARPTDHCPQKSTWPANSGNNRLSRRLLHDLRNRIPIQGLIAKHLGLRYHTDASIFRFECPLCTSFHTSVKKDKNLARCFDCKANFNPIDMVMAVRKTEFRQSADFLIPLLESGPVKKQHICGAGSFSQIGEILSEKNIPKALPERTNSERRIERLEKQISGLNKRMDQLHKFIVTAFSKP